MNTEMGEYLAGAYLKLIEKCDFVNYNVRRPNGKLAGLNEIDVIGLDFKHNAAYLCEVTTHLDGLLYKDKTTTVERIEKKYQNMQNYAKDFLPHFTKRQFMFWSPRVSWSIESELKKLKGLDLIINGKYSANIEALKEIAKRGTSDTGNPAFRVFQILGHLRPIIES